MKSYKNFKTETVGIPEFDKIRKDGRLLIEYIRGSVSYGLDTPESDKDSGGIYICSIKELLGYNTYKEEIADSKNDNKWYELNKFISLLVKANPNILEALFVDDNFIIGEIHPIMKYLREHRNMFLTKQCFISFYKYAESQIYKARGLNKKIVNPIKERKTPLDFTYTFKRQGSTNILTFLNDYGLHTEYCGLCNINHMQYIYGCYYDYGRHLNEHPEDRERLINVRKKLNPDRIYRFPNIEDEPIIHYRGLTTEIVSNTTQLRLSSIDDKNDMPFCYISYNVDGFQDHCRRYKEYKEWEQNRNPVRYESNLNKNYDCYLNSETEFLTINGWKKYDDILDNELIASFDNNHNIEFVPILNRFSDSYSGTIYTFENRYTRFSVTANHKMYVSPIHRNISTNFSTKYIKEKSNWQLIKIKDLFDDTRSYFHQLRHLNNNNKDYNITDDELIILGAFLSEGTFEYNKNHEINAIRIGQYEHKDFTNIIRNIKSINIKEYKSIRNEKNDIEISWIIRDSNILNICKQCNGYYSYEKELPSFCNKLSKRQVDILLHIMILGDGTKNKNNGHYVYYTSSKKLADSLYTLLLCNGYNCQFYGCNDNYLHKNGYKRKDNIILPKYQIFISKNTELTNMIHFNENDKHWSIRNVNNERIVCFENKNHTLVTRNNYKVAFHGNCKNMMHSFRLIHMAKEIASGKGMNLYRTEDHDFLMNIRNHKYEYDELIKLADKEKEEMYEIMKHSTIPDSVDETKLNEILFNLRMMQIKEEMK